MRRVFSPYLALSAAGLVVATPTSSSAAPGKCDVPLIDPVCEAGKTIVSKAGEAVVAPINYAAESAVEMFTAWVAEAAQWVLGKVIGFIEQSTTPALDAEWFTERYRFMIGLAALVLLPMLLIATIRAVVTQDVAQLLRSFFIYLPTAIFGTFIAVTITQAVLAATDALSAAVAENIAGDVSQIFDSVGSTLSRSVGGVSPATPSFAIFFSTLLLIVGSFFVWLELLVRSAAVTVAVFFLPMILAGLVWPSAMRWTKRLIEILVALILSKFVVVAVISLATAALADPGAGGFGTVMGAAALMLMAAFAPFALLKLIPMVEGASIDHLQALGRRPMEVARANGSVNNAISVMRSKTQSGAAPGLAVAGAGSGMSRAGAAAGSPGLATQTAQGVTQTPRKDAESHVVVAKKDEAAPPGASRDERSARVRRSRGRSGKQPRDEQ